MTIVLNICASTSTLLTNADYITGQINDVADKLEQAESHLGRTSFLPLPEQDRKQDDKLAKAAKDWYVEVRQIIVWIHL
jgi:COP9 signalosome complex subunit 5